jgi:hypothetical protein
VRMKASRRDIYRFNSHFLSQSDKPILQVARPPSSNIGASWDRDGQFGNDRLRLVVCLGRFVRYRT